MERSGDPKTAVGNGPHVSFWIRELPFSLVLILTLLGVAYTSFLKQPIMGYWELLAPMIGLVCVSSGWSSANGRKARIQLIVTQALHWTAFLLVMNMILLPSVQTILNANATGLAVLMLLALGTFTSGVHILSWQIGLLGIIMALLRSGRGLDRSFSSDCRVDFDSGARIRLCALVALARKPRPKNLSEGADEATTFNRCIDESNCAVLVAVVFLQVTPQHRQRLLDAREIFEQIRNDRMIC